jgi:hypothetical protein
MRVYRIRFTYEHGTSNGYSWRSSKADVNRACREYMRGPDGEDLGDADGRACEVETIELPKLTKGNVIDLLNKYGAHADNG